jgi:hypothetical protein
VAAGSISLVPACLRLLLSAPVSIPSPKSASAPLFSLLALGDKQLKRLPFRGGCWDLQSIAGVFAFDLWRTRSFSASTLGVRAASLFSQVYPAQGLGVSTMRKKGLSPAFWQKQNLCA